MPYYESPYGSGKYRYFDPIKLSEPSGLRGLTEHILDWMGRHHHDWADKYDLFVMFPILEQIDYNRQIYEAQHPVRIEDRRLDNSWEAFCCWPYPCVLCASLGCTVHWPWRAHFEKKLPYWHKDVSVP